MTIEVAVSLASEVLSTRPKLMYFEPLSETGLQSKHIEPYVALSLLGNLERHWSWSTTFGTRSPTDRMEFQCHFSRLQEFMIADVIDVRPETLKCRLLGVSTIITCNCTVCPDR